MDKVDCFLVLGSLSLNLETATIGSGLMKKLVIFDFKFEDFELLNYQSHPGIKAVVAV